MDEIAGHYVRGKQSVLQSSPVEDPIVTSSSGRLTHCTQSSLRGHCSLGYSPLARPLHQCAIAWKINSLAYAIRVHRALARTHCSTLLYQPYSDTIVLT